MRYLFAVLIVALFTRCEVAGAATLEQIVSREHPAYDNAKATLSIGRDGKVYLTNRVPGRGNAIFLRVTPDGSEKTAARPSGAIQNVTANAQGVIAVANAHLAPAVILLGPDMRQRIRVTEFSAGAKEGYGGGAYRAPSNVETAPSGDFYAADQYRKRIVRFNSDGKVVKVHTFTEEPEKVQLAEFRVDEKNQQFIIAAARQPLRAVGFDGKTRWSVKARYSGGFDVDDEGTLYSLNAVDSAVQKYSADGKPASQIKLQRPQASSTPITGLRVRGNEIYIKRSHATEMFERYERDTGKLAQITNIDFERLTATFPDGVWPSGQAMPFELKFDSGKNKVAPQWRVWARPINAPLYRELPRESGTLRIPASMSGLFHVKVSAETQPVQSGPAQEYLLQTLVQAHAPGARGTANVLTPSNRVYYGQGEEVPLQVLVRAPANGMPTAVTLKLVDGHDTDTPRTLAQYQVTIKDGKASHTLPAALSASLRPGSYSVEAEADGLASIGQTLIIGPGVFDRTPFFRLQYGDYLAQFPDGDVWNMPDMLTAQLERSRQLGMNMFVDRLGVPRFRTGLQWNNNNGGRELAAFKAQLAASATGVAPEKADIEAPLLQTLAGYSAAGIQQMAILASMDAGLPLGTGLSKRLPAEYEEEIQNTSGAMLPYPAFRGWSWTANWWLSAGNRGADAAESPADKAAYEAAIKRAEETGAWDPTIDKVATRRWNLAVEAQQIFEKKLRQVAPGDRMITATSGPYRSPHSYPPVTFSNVDEVDLHYQAEQIQPPNTFPHNVDFQKRPGKRAWGHPELWNDGGNGGQITSTLFSMAMRGADGVGNSGLIPNFPNREEDSRSPAAGAASMYRSVYRTLEPYGPWLLTLQPSDPLAIIVSRRQSASTEWSGGLGSKYFTRLYEAYQSALYAHYPASFVFTDDLKPGTLDRYRAVLLVGQTVEIEPELKSALASAKAKGAHVFYDGTSRESLVKDYSPLGIAFNKAEDAGHLWQDDSAYMRVPGFFVAHAEVLRKLFRPHFAPVAEIGHSEILPTERASGDGRFLWLVNNAIPREGDPGQLWRVTLAMTNRLPVSTPVTLPQPGGAIYDVFAMRRVEAKLTADLRHNPARLYAMLPAPIEAVALQAPAEVAAGANFTWTALVRDYAGKPINSTVPVHVRLLDGSGEVLVERHGAAPAAGWRETFVMPLNAGAGVTLEATELFSGRTNRLPIKVTSAAPGQPASAVPAIASTLTVARSGAQPVERLFGPKLRDIAVSADGSHALVNALEWNRNVYSIDLASGKIAASQSVGDAFAYAPQTVQGGFAVQGYDRGTAEGYHLYLTDASGAAQRRFALYGLPRRATQWLSSGRLTDRINNFAVAPSGNWVAAAGDLGLAVWNRSGQPLWSRDWWQSERKTLQLVALDETTLLTGDGMTVAALDASTGKAKWETTLADSGQIVELIVTPDGRTVVARTDLEGGRVYVLRGGKIERSILTRAQAVGVARDGSTLAVSDAQQIKLYSVENGFAWTFTGDDVLRVPRFSPDGSRIAIGSELGTLYVLGADGKVLHRRDTQALPVPAWLPNGDLVLATWSGDVARLDSNYNQKWLTKVQPEISGAVAPVAPAVPTARMSGWGNALEKPLPLTPNLLKDPAARVTVSFERGNGAVLVDLLHPAALLTDGDAAPPAGPWVDWYTINLLNSGWRGDLSIVMDTGAKRPVRLDAITLVEDPQQPHSWLRDAVLEYWDAQREIWLPAGRLLSDRAAHSHRLPKPVQSTKFRIVRSESPGSWPVGNIRLGELVLHGEVVKP